MKIKVLWCDLADTNIKIVGVPEEYVHKYRCFNWYPRFDVMKNITYQMYVAHRRKLWYDERGKWKW